MGALGDVIDSLTGAVAGASFGWLGLDPTNAIAVGDDHIVLAIGRDYADVAPVEGVIVSSGGQALDVEVDVTPRGNIGVK